jgi:hypothetical protein
MRRVVVDKCYSLVYTLQRLLWLKRKRKEKREEEKERTKRLVLGFSNRSDGLRYAVSFDPTLVLIRLSKGIADIS